MERRESKTYSEDEIKQRLEQELPKWYFEDGWIRRKFKTSGWKGTLMVVNTVGHLAEAAWHRRAPYRPGVVDLPNDEWWICQRASARHHQRDETFERLHKATSRASASIAYRSPSPGDQLRAATSSNRSTKRSDTDYSCRMLLLGYWARTRISAAGRANARPCRRSRALVGE